MSSVKTEFLVQMTCDSCVQAVKNSLANLDGVLNVEINFSTGSVVVDSTLSIPQIQSALESTGRKVAIKGYDGSISAVSMLNTGDVQGVVRFVQINRDTCIVDGTIDGLHPVSHSLAVHEYGDLSKGCQSVGNIMHLGNETDRVYGDLGSISVEENGRASFRFEDHIIKLSELIGRSLVVKAKGVSIFI
ncbi:copper chaperone for superoxide dismutase-like isoform X2 [Cylas formicarius]|uniref:copper chaperone for superoxide dismutase-like isoform X2 n=1 Tax=Cylas formicarius TaxID=197179 RepID=UPI002958494F|nr:copper chaperone for superoxide dismutase-like isoform X2 [Cylas formicarius]